jgi:hypothetical protein
MAGEHHRPVALARHARDQVTRPGLGRSGRSVFLHLHAQLSELGEHRVRNGPLVAGWAWNLAQPNEAIEHSLVAAHELEGYAVRRNSERIVAMSPSEALRICFRREHLRRTLRIALVVGTILTLINQLDVILKGDAVTLTWIKAGLNYCVPFIVSNLGLLAGKRADAERARGT